MKYETREDVNPAAERMLSRSCIVSKKIIWPEERYRMSLARIDICLVKTLRWLEMTLLQYVINRTKSAKEKPYRIGILLANDGIVFQLAGNGLVGLL
jgi:hypothetical protein